jgi:hypothetical protein
MARILHTCVKCGVVKMMEPVGEDTEVWEVLDICKILYEGLGPYGHSVCGGTYRPLTLGMEVK